MTGFCEMIRKALLALAAVSICMTGLRAQDDVLEPVLLPVPDEAAARTARVPEPQFVAPAPDEIEQPAELAPMPPAPPEKADEMSDDEITAPQDQQQDDAEPQADIEIVRERYPNRRVKIERQVTQDGFGNFINHGSWKWWDENGDLIAEGQYRHGNRHGLWTRLHQPTDAKLLVDSPFRLYQEPFTSQATFEDGRLHGTWTISDANGDKICEWQFAHGQRHGEWSWWYPGGDLMREVQFKDGLVHGTHKEWQNDGELTVDHTYRDGRHLAPETKYYDDGNRKQWEGTLLRAMVILNGTDDWWEAKLAPFEVVGDDERHGKWTEWYENGQKKLEGVFHNNRPVGRFIWWHANGQKATEGFFKEGQQHGKWNWWHANGQRKTEAEFTDGSPSGFWTWWQEDGQLAQRSNYSDAPATAAPIEDVPHEAVRLQPVPTEGPVYRLRD